jgi:hypothetical protein
MGIDCAGTVRGTSTTRMLLAKLTAVPAPYVDGEPQQPWHFRIGEMLECLPFLTLHRRRVAETRLSRNGALLEFPGASRTRGEGA